MAIVRDLPSKKGAEVHIFSHAISLKFTYLLIYRHTPLAPLVRGELPARAVAQMISTNHPIMHPCIIINTVSNHDFRAYNSHRTPTLNCLNGPGNIPRGARDAMYT